MTPENRNKRVYADRLRQLGFSDDLIDDAIACEKTGLLDIEPSPGLVERTMAACEGLFPAREQKRECEE